MLSEEESMGVLIKKAIGIAKYPFAWIQHHLGYLFYKNNLNNQIKALDLKIESFHLRVAAARGEGDKPLQTFKEWLREAEEKSEEAKRFLNYKGHEMAKCSCRGRPFPYLALRQNLSRKARKMADTIVGEIRKANTFTPEVMFYTPDKKCYFEHENYVAFDTTKQALMDTMEALKDPNLRKIGVYGMGGVGKSTLLEAVAEEVQKEGLFSEVVMVTVSQSYVLEKIQQEIAEKLGLGKLEDESLSLRAEKLQCRFSQEHKNFLLIIDDLWENINLEDAGIYFKDDQRGCKMVLVSRNRNVLCRMDVEKDIFVATLSDDEAMYLFKKFVGDIVENPRFKPLAAEILRECQGLPIAVATIAVSLKGRDQIFFWEDALAKLEWSAKQGYDNVFTSIKRSYDVLEREDKKFLSLCSIHGQDANISVDNLVNIYVTGCNFSQEDDTLIKDARNSVDISVNRLKDCCLLLDGDDLGTVKMHNVIRDVVMSVASNDNGMHCFTNVDELEVGLNEGKLKDSTAISLLGRDFSKFPENLTCPGLELLLLLIGKDYQSLNIHSFRQAMQIPDRCFERAKQLRAVYFDSINIESLPPSFCFLLNLQTLSLQGCTLEEQTLIGIAELKNLLVLNLSKSNFTGLPKQIGQLTQLRLLNVNSCKRLMVIQPNLISRLVHLEELYMLDSFIAWEMEGNSGERRNASLTELMNLPRLRALHLCIPDVGVVPKQCFSENLEKFNIIVGFANSKLQPNPSSRTLALNLHESNLLDQDDFQVLMKKAQVMYLGTLPVVSNIVNQLDADGFPRLKILHVQDSNEIQHIIEFSTSFGAFQSLETLKLGNLPNLKSICDGRSRIEAFGQLRRIRVKYCNKLIKVFSFSIATNLEKIEVSSCSMMEEIVYHGSKDGAHNAIDGEATNGDPIAFRQLSHLTLKDLPSLVQFCSPSDSFTPLLFGEKVTFPSLEVLKLYGLNFSCLWPLWPNQLPTTSMQKLTMLIVKDCCNLECLLPFSIIGSLAQLEHLVIRECPVMEEVLVILEPVVEERRSKNILFPKLRSLKLEFLASLKRICEGDCNIVFESLLELIVNDCPKLKTFTNTNSMPTLTTVDEEPLFNEKVAFPSLERLVVENCGSSKYLFSYAMVRSVSQLHFLKVSSCKSMEVIVKEPYEVERELETISFSKLKDLEFDSLPNLKRFCYSDCCIEFPSIIQLSITNCFELSTSVTHSRPKLILKDERDVEESDMVAAHSLLDEKVVFPGLEVLALCSFSAELWLPEPSCMPNLTSLLISECHTGKFLLPFPSGIFAQLEHLEISRCPFMEEVVGINEQVEEEGRLEKISLPKLRSLKLKNLVSLKRFCAGDCINIECGNLEEFIIQDCPQLEIFTANITPTSTRIEEIE